MSTSAAYLWIYHVGPLVEGEPFLRPGEGQSKGGAQVRGRQDRGMRQSQDLAPAWRTATTSNV